MRFGAVYAQVRGTTSARVMGQPVDDLLGRRYSLAGLVWRTGQPRIL